MFRSSRGGCLHSVVLSEAVLDTDSETLAEAVLLAAGVSHLQAIMQIRQEILDAGFTPSAQVPGARDLDSAASALRMHRLRLDQNM
jgi:hypothetical protein